MTREELCQALWPGDTFVDFDHGLNNGLNGLHKFLDPSLARRIAQGIRAEGLQVTAPMVCLVFVKTALPTIFADQAQREKAVAALLPVFRRELRRATM